MSARLPAKLRAMLAADPGLAGRLEALVDRDSAPTTVSAANDLARVVGPLLAGRIDEALVCVALDGRNQVLASVVLTIGSDKFTIVESRQIYRWALTCSTRPATSIALAHNHPSGDPVPSRQDIDCTSRVAAAGRVLGIRLLDHLVYVDGPAWRSLSEDGHLPAYAVEPGWTT